MVDRPSSILLVHSSPIRFSTKSATTACNNRLCLAICHFSAQRPSSNQLDSSSTHIRFDAHTDVTMQPPRRVRSTK